MIEKKTFDFLKGLAAHNDRSWFEANRDKYEHAKTNVLEFAAALIKELGKKDSGIALLEPKQCIFRINRDVRFSKNKSPYKTNMSVYLNEHGKGSETAGYYLHIEPGKSFAAAGTWQPPTPHLKKIRQEIDYNFSDFQKILSNKTFSKHFSGLQQDDKLMRPPKGYEEGNLALDFLKLKSFIASTALTDTVVQSADAAKNITATFVAASPLINFINIALKEDD